MATHRFRAVFLFLVLALVLTTTGCRGTSSNQAGHSSRDGGAGHHLPWFSSSHEPDPQASTAAALKKEAAFAPLNREMDQHPMKPRVPPQIWVSPLAGQLRVTRAFQPPPSRYASGHRGVDLAGSARQRVQSAGDGTVSWAGVLAGRGVVVVSHGELRTTYEPVVAEVKKGWTVRAGDEIATLQPGHPDCPVAACLHWGLLRGSTYLDPMSLLNRDVRLLPLGTGR